MENLKYEIKHLSKKFKVLLATGSLVLAGGIIGGCVSKSNEQVDDQTTEILTDAETTESVTEKTTENTTRDLQEKYIREYKHIDAIEDSIVEFNENCLPNGFVKVDEDNKYDMADMYLNSYIMINSTELNGNLLQVLNQDKNLISRNIVSDFMGFALQIAKYSQIQTPETVLDFSKMYENTNSNKNDIDFLTKLSDEIAYMNVAKDYDERQTRINNIIAIKNSLLTGEDNNIMTSDYSATTLYIALNMIIEADATAKAYGNEIFTEEEDKMQLYTTYYEYACKDALQYGYIDEEEFKKLVSTESEFYVAGPSQSSFESIYLSTAAAIVDDTLKSLDEHEYDLYYAFDKVSDRIADRIDKLYVEPEYTNVEQENEIREDVMEAYIEENIGSTEVVEVPADEVPEEVKEEYPTTEETKDEKTGEVITKSYAEGLRDGRTTGSDAAWNTQLSTGSIPGNISAAEVSVPNNEYGNDYAEGYKAGYAEGWNVYVESAKDAYQKATTSFESTEGTTEFVSESASEVVTTEATTETKKETTTEATTEAKKEAKKEATTEATTAVTTEAATETTYFIPVDDAEEEIIDDGEDTITNLNRSINELKALRMFVESLGNDNYQLDNTENTKIM